MYGEIDILVLNAGVNAHFEFLNLEDTSVFNKMMDVNYFGYVYCCL